MRLGGCVVLYNPGDSVLENVASYLPFLERLVAVDNSDESEGAVELLGGYDKVEIVSMGGNKGIAAALNAGCSLLLDAGFDVALTMDQDSKFPIKDSQAILEQVGRLIGEYAIVGLNFNSNETGDPSELVDTKYWLTSGNFLDLHAYSKAGGFDERLFIDYVDIEYGHRLKLAGMKEGYLKNFSLSHSIGNPIEISLFGKTFRAMNHAPVRYYYRYRNSRYLYGTDASFYRDKYFRELFINIPKMLLFEPFKKEKVRMIIRGLSDGRRAKLGPYEGGNNE